MKCGVCGKKIETTFLGKLVGTKIKNKLLIVKIIKFFNAIKSSTRLIANNWRKLINLFWLIKLQNKLIFNFDKDFIFF